LEAFMNSPSNQQIADVDSPRGVHCKHVISKVKALDGIMTHKVLNLRHHAPGGKIPNTRVKG
jgi:hypothetical protein